MDFSKLPRLSKTGAPPADLPDARSPEMRPTAAVAPNYGEDPLGSALEVWLSLVIGVLFLFLGLSYGKYLWASWTGQPYHTGVTWGESGAEVKYTELLGAVMQSDRGFFVFAIVLFLDAAVRVAVRLRMPFKQPVVMGVMALTVLAIGCNLYAAAKVYATGNLPILSILPVAFGGFVLFSQMMLLGPAEATAIAPSTFRRSDAECC